MVLDVSLFLQGVEQKAALSVIWDNMKLMWRHSSEVNFFWLHMNGPHCTNTGLLLMIGADFETKYTFNSCPDTFYDTQNYLVFSPSWDGASRIIFRGR